MYGKALLASLSLFGILLALAAGVQCCKEDGSYLHLHLVAQGKLSVLNRIAVDFSKSLPGL